LHLAQALSNRGRRGRKRNFVDAERLVKRLVARELTLSFVPDAERRLWRAVTRKKYQLRRVRRVLLYSETFPLKAAGSLRFHFLETECAEGIGRYQHLRFSGVN